MKKLVAVGAVLLANACAAPDNSEPAPRIVSIPTTASVTPTPTKPALKVVLVFHLSRYPNIADHIRDAQAAGWIKTCTIDRRHATQHRKESLADEPAPPKGKDRDEYPPAMCAEGGKLADVRLVPSTENRSAGAWMGNQLKKYPNGTVVTFRVVK